MIIGKLTANTKVNIQDTLHKLHIWQGPNGAGKTSRFEAIDLAVNGKRTAGHVADLLRPNETRLYARLDLHAPHTVNVDAVEPYEAQAIVQSHVFDSAAEPPLSLEKSASVPSPYVGAIRIVRPATWLTALGPARAREEVMARWGAYALAKMRQPIAGNSTNAPTSLLAAPASLNERGKQAWDEAVRAAQSVIVAFNEKHTRDPMPIDDATVLAEMSSIARKSKLEIGRRRDSLEKSIQDYSKASSDISFAAEDLQRLETLLQLAEQAEREEPARQHRAGMLSHAAAVLKVDTEKYMANYNEYVASKSSATDTTAEKRDQYAEAVKTIDAELAKIPDVVTHETLMAWIEKYELAKTGASTVRQEENAALLASIVTNDSQRKQAMLALREKYVAAHRQAESILLNDESRQAYLRNEHDRIVKEADRITREQGSIPAAYTGESSASLRSRLSQARVAFANRSAIANMQVEWEQTKQNWETMKSVESAASITLTQFTQLLAEHINTVVRYFMPPSMRDRFAFDVDACRFYMVGNDVRVHTRNELCGREFATLTYALAKAWAHGGPYIMLLDYRNDLADFDGYGALAEVMQTIADTSMQDPECIMVGITTPVGLPIQRADGSVDERWHVQACTITPAELPTLAPASTASSGVTPIQATLPLASGISLPGEIDASEGMSDGLAASAPAEPRRKRGRPRKGTTPSTRGR